MPLGTKSNPLARYALSRRRNVTHRGTGAFVREVCLVSTRA